MLSFGVCICCERKFWWTGKREEVPDCGGCGRKHTKLDYSLGKLQMRREEGAEQNRRRGRVA